METALLILFTVVALSVCVYLIYRSYNIRKIEYNEREHKFQVTAPPPKKRVAKSVKTTRDVPSEFTRNGKRKHPLHNQHGGTFTPMPKLHLHQKVG